MAQPKAKGIVNIVTGKYPAKDKDTGQFKVDQYGNQIMNDQTLAYGEWTDWGDVISIEVPNGFGGSITLKIFKPKNDQQQGYDQPHQAPQQPQQGYGQQNGYAQSHNPQR